MDMWGAGRINKSTKIKSRVLETGGFSFFVFSLLVLN